LKPVKEEKRRKEEIAERSECHSTVPLSILWLLHLPVSMLTGTSDHKL